MSGNVKQFVDFSTNTNNDTGENNAGSIQPMVDGENVTGTVLARPSESLRQRTEAIRDVMSDSLYLRDADRGWVISGPRPTVTWPGSTTVSASGIPVLSNSLWILPLLTPGFPQVGVPPVASSFGSLSLKRSSDSMNSILVTSRRRSYAAGDQINVTVSSGASFSCALDAENGLERTISVVATSTTTLSTVITALNAVTPASPDNTQLVTAALQGGASGSDFILSTQARQYVSGNYDGEAHSISASVLAGFFSSNPTQALAEGDTLCVRYDMVVDRASTGGRRQSIPENSNTALSTGSLFNSRVHPEFLANAIPVCKVLNNDLVFSGGRTIRAGATSIAIDGDDASGVTYAGGPAWADGTTNPSTTVEAQLDKILTDLGTAGGTAKVEGSAVSTDLAAGTLATQISSLATGWLKMDRDNTISGSQTFQKNTIVGGSLTVGGQPLPFSDFTFTADSTTDLLSATGHPLQTGDGPLRNTSGGTPPGNLPLATDFYAVFVDANHIKAATSRANAIAGITIDITSNGTGTQTIQHQAGTTRVTDAEITRNLTVDGGLSTGGGAVIGGGLTVTGAASFSDVATSTLEVSGAATLSGGITGQLILNSSVSPAALPDANTNDYSIGNVSIVRLSGTPATTPTLTGIAGGSSNRLVHIVNVSSTTIVLGHQNTASSPANRFIFPGASNISLAIDDAVTVIYDSATTRWRLFGKNF